MVVAVTSVQQIENLSRLPAPYKRELYWLDARFEKLGNISLAVVNVTYHFMDFT
jgi:hypothetical protein